MFNNLLEYYYYYYLLFISFFLFYIIFYILINKFDLHPMKNLIYFILFMIFMNLFLYFMNYKSICCFMIMIIFISGLVVLFSYFISLMNKSWLNYFSYFNLLIIFFLIVLIMFFFKYYSIENFFNLNYLINEFGLKNNLMMIYIYPNMLFLMVMILFLFYILVMSYKMSYSKQKTFRQMKNN